MAARIEGREKSVAAIAGRLATSFGPAVDRCDGAASAAWWQRYVDRQGLEHGATSVLIRCGVRPRDTGTLVLGMIDAMDQLDASLPELWASPGLGTVTARVELGEDSSPDRLAETQSILMALTDTITILAAPPEWKRGLDVWGRLPDGFEVMRALRAEFDPKRTVNPGRFAGFL
jgi:glycolate oxidase FAD binding subunit